MFDLIAVAKSASSAVSLVSGGAFKAALDAIATVEMKAAQDAWSKTNDSAEPREALNRAISHLESAHVALAADWKSSVSSFVRRYKADRTCLLDAQVCCLLAAAHHALGDGKAIVLRALDDAENALKAEDSLTAGAAVFHMINPVNYIDIFSESPSIPPLSKIRIAESQLTKFKALLME